MNDRYNIILTLFAPTASHAPTASSIPSVFPSGSAVPSAYPSLSVLPSSTPSVSLFPSSEVSLWYNGTFQYSVGTSSVK